MLSRSLYFLGMEPTRKSREERRYLLVKTKAKKLNAKREAVNLLSKYYKRKEPVENSNQNQGKKVNSTPRHFSSYVSVLANKHPTTNPPFNITRPNILNQRQSPYHSPPILIKNNQILFTLHHRTNSLAKITNLMIALPHLTTSLVKITHLSTIITNQTPM